MTTAHQEQPSLREHIDDTRQYLSAVAEKLAAHGRRVPPRRDNCGATWLLFSGSSLPGTETSAPAQSSYAVSPHDYSSSADEATR